MDSTMAWRVWSRLCYGQKWLFLFPPLLLLLLPIAISLMTLTLPLPVPPADIDRRASRALSSAGKFSSWPRGMEPPPVAAPQQPLPHIYSGASNEKHTTKHFWNVTVDDQKNLKRQKERNPAQIDRNKHKIRGSASNRKRLAGTDQHPSNHHDPRSTQFSINATTLKRTKPRSHSAEVKPSAKTYLPLERKKITLAHISDPAYTLLSERRAADKQAGRWRNRRAHKKADTHIHSSNAITKTTERHLVLAKQRQQTKHSGKSDKVDLEQQAVKKPSEDPFKAKKDSRLLDQIKVLPGPKEVVKKDESEWCQSFPIQEFTDTDHRRIRISADLQPPPWLSDDDIQKMELLAEGEVVSKARVPAHGQVLQVALDPHPRHQQQPQHEHSQSHGKRCQQGQCSLIKRTDDWFEVFAFHLDRVLGLNRSLPAVLRTFQSDILPYRYITHVPRPVVWWDPGIQHLSDGDNDQNSVQLSWVQYQKLLRFHCGIKTELGSEPCVGVHHAEWGRLALFDFLLQVNDRLDRYCCGFIPDPQEVCVENLLYNKCGNTNGLQLVHILVRKTDPSRLVFIDNAGRPQQPTDNLNFRLVEGIDEFPEKAVSLLQSGCLENLLLRSLYTDRVFWDSQGGASGLRPLIHIVEQRGKILLQHIKMNKSRLIRDL